MYWLYLTLFISAVLVPKLIQSNLSFVSEESAEELAILVLGTMGFLLFLWQERKSILHWKERNEAQRSVNQISKDLIESYSYIGEINRKIDILQEVISELPGYLNEGKEKEKEAQSGILNSLKSLIGSDQFAVYFCNVSSGKIESILKLNSKISLTIPPEALCKKERKIDQELYLIVDIPHEIKGFQVTLVAMKKKNHTPEDITIIKVLISILVVYYLAINFRPATIAN